MTKGNRPGSNKRNDRLGLGELDSSSHGLRFPEPLEMLLTEFREKYADSSTVAAQLEPLRSTPTGSLALDIALGIGGWPIGRVIEIYGPEGSGKSTLALSAIAHAQANNGYAAIIDTDMALDPNLVRRLGIDPNQLIVSQPDTAEQAFEIVERLVRSEAVEIVVIDSLPALVTRAEIEGEMGDDHEGSQDAIIEQALRRLSGIFYRSNALLIFVNQIRIREGVRYGNPESTPGGPMLKAQASVRVDLRSTGLVKRKGVIVGKRIRAKIVKSKVAAPFRRAEFDLLFGKGICRQADGFDVAKEARLIRRREGKLMLGGATLGKDRAEAIEALERDGNLADALGAAVREHFAATFARNPVAP